MLVILRDLTQVYLITSEKKKKTEHNWIEHLKINASTLPKKVHICCPVIKLLQIPSSQIVS